MPKQSPCGGCPPHCAKCVFSSLAAGTPAKTSEVVSKEHYGCIRPDGGAVVLAGEKLGMMRGEHFHPVTPEGAEFLRASGNALAVHC